MILVTGATGNVGRPLVGLLSDAGVPFRAFVRDSERARASLDPTVESAEGDFAEPATLDTALGGSSGCSCSQGTRSWRPTPWRRRSGRTSGGW